MRLRLTLCGLLLAATGCKGPAVQNLPPSEMLMHPGPGVDGPGPGVMMLGDPGLSPYPAPTSQVAFVGPEGTVVNWDITAPGAFDSEPLVAPGRYNFPQGAIYRLKLTNVPGREGIELYPTLEIGPSTPRTDAYLAHNVIPVEFTEEDLDQVLVGNFVTKVIYLPDPEFQELALAGVSTLVSTRLDPGVDPIVEADRRGAIMAVIRLGNKDLEVPASGELVGGGMMGGAIPVGYCGPDGAPQGMPPQFVAGVTAPQYGLTSSGTPIGLPGPPHIPHGAPAGLQQHVMRNHTPVRMPGPVERFTVDVRQHPGYSYPRPSRHMAIREFHFKPWNIFRRPRSNSHVVTEPHPSEYAAECTDCQ